MTISIHDMRILFTNSGTSCERENSIPEIGACGRAGGRDWRAGGIAAHIIRLEVYAKGRNAV